MSQLSRAVNAQAAKPTGALYTGIYLRMEGALAVVSLQGADVAVPFAGTVQPVPGAVVNVEHRKGAGYLMLGPVKSPPTRGRVTATGTPLVTVLGSDGVSYEVPFMSAYTPAVDDDVAIDWSEAGGLVRGKVSTTPTAATPDPVAVPGTSYHPTPFLATAAGFHYSSGTYNPYFPNWDGRGQKAAAWYGAAVADSIPDDAIILSARLYLSQRSGSGDNPSAVQLIEGEGPGGRVAVGASHVLEARSGWVPIPLELVDVLKVGGHGLSVLNGGADNDSISVLNKLADDPLSFALDLSWSVGTALAE